MITADWETRSECDLKKEGAFKYSVHPSTEFTCLGFKFDSDPSFIFDFKLANSPWEVVKKTCPALAYRLNDPTEILSAHNAFFEQCMYNNILVKRYGWPPLPINRWKCTAAKAAAHALPRNLAGAGMAAKLNIQKDLDAHRLLMKVCKPLKLWKEKGLGPKWHEDPSDMQKIYDYCARDVESEYELDKKLSDLNAEETKVWCLDQLINSRGVHVDTKAVDRIIGMIDEEVSTKKRKTQEINLGCFESVNQVQELIRYLEIEGVYLPNLRAKTIADALMGDKLSPDARALLEIRQQVSKTSTKKYRAFQARAFTDGRIRDLILYWGASTGRWAGTGIQPQNFPRGNIYDTDLAIDLIMQNDLESLTLLYGDVMNLFSSVLRGMITATPGTALFCADYNAIEARMLFWFANHQAGLDVFRSGQDPYVSMAAVIFGIPASKVTKAQRQVGKQAILGCGYGMGAKKFEDTCAAYSITLEDGIADRAVKAYRSTHAPVVKCWYNYEQAAMLAIRGKTVRVNNTKWFRDKDFLYCELPSGRRLAYADPSIKMAETAWKETKETVHYWAVNSRTKKWNEEKTYGGKLCENIVQAGSRDIMAHAMLNAEARGYKMLLTIHDELLCEKESGSVDEFCQILTDLPAWAKGAAVTAEGWTGPRYKK